MSSATTTPPPDLTIEEILRIYLIAFDSSVQSFRADSVASFGPSPLGEDYIKVHHNFLAGRGKLPAGTSETLEKAHKNWNLCENFWMFVYEELKAHLNKYGATIEWANVDPRPQTTLVDED
jgi:hypothetical protein